MSGGNVTFDFSFAPNSGRVVYRADRDTDEVRELYSVTLGGVLITSKLNPSLAPGGHVFNFQISPDGGRVVYCASPDGVWELFAVPITGPATKGVKISGSLVSGGMVNPYAYQITPDSSRVVYIADQETDEVFELFMTTMESSQLIYLPLITR